jgi:predicted phosphodiesterase
MLKARKRSGGRAGMLSFLQKNRDGFSSDSIALISDIHGNLEALSSVLQDIQRMRIKQIVCLGDIVGYGPDPDQCINVIRENKIITLKGNHDAYVNSDEGLGNANKMAIESILWTRKRLSIVHKQWLLNLPLILSFEGFSTVHSTLREPDKWNYILQPSQATTSFQLMVEPILFIGHSHSPTVFLEHDGIISQIQTKAFKIEEGSKYIVNVGSVGQPRDGQYLATYVVYDKSERNIEVRRVTYNTAAVKQKIIERGLPAANAIRLGN